MFLANHNSASVTDPSITDPYWKEVVYYARFDNALTQDDSGIGATTANGAGATRTTATSKFGGASFSKASGANYLTLAAASNTRFNMGTGDFTMEHWVYFPGNAPATGNYAGLCLNATTNGADGGTWIPINRGVVTSTYWRMGFYNGSSSGGLFAYHSTEMVPATWYHYAVCRVSGTILAFMNGAMNTLGTMSRSISTAGPAYLGQDPYNEYNYAALYDDVRVTKGVARYTQSFAPPVKAHPTPTLP